MARFQNLRGTIALGAGAAAGALSRYYLGQGTSAIVKTPFPVSTFLVNLSGCFLMGVIVAVITDFSAIHPDLKLSLTTGFLGAYTTFSSYGLDMSQLLNQSELRGQLFYGLGSPLMGFLGLQVGMITAKKVIFSLKKKES